MFDTTLQINLSPGDIGYAHLTVPALAQAHRRSVDEILAVVDCCRPQRTKIVDPDQRFPAPIFAERVERIRHIAEQLKADGYVDRIVYLLPESPLLPTLSRKYLNNLVHETHDYGGCALMSYLAALELPSTRYLVHYDADMLLHQSAGYDWAREAVSLLDRDVHAVAATPRSSPPLEDGHDKDAPTLHDGRPLVRVEGGWHDDWFSTRCFLFDREKFKNYLPLLKGRTALDTIAAKLMKRGYPRSPEMMMFRRIGKGGGRRLNLNSKQAWLLHPLTKPPEYIAILPQILEAIRDRQIPEAQRGQADINLSAWQSFLTQAPMMEVQHK